MDNVLQLSKHYYFVHILSRLIILTAIHNLVPIRITWKACQQIAGPTPRVSDSVHLG